MSNKYKILYSSKDAFYAMVSQKVSDWMEQLSSIEQTLFQFSSMESFQGRTADSVKAYINEVHGILLVSVKQTIADFQSRLTMYTQGFYDIEPNLYASLPQETMHDLKSSSIDRRAYLAQEKDAIGVILNSISDLVAINNPSQQNLTDSLQDMEGRINDLDTSLVNYETTKSNDINGALAELITTLKTAINVYIQLQGCITGYNAGDFTKRTEILDLYEKVTGSMTYIQQNSEKISDAAEEMQKSFAQQQKDYEEACEARKDEGLANIIIGGLAVVAGVAAIVLTAGAATPIVAVAAVSGTCTAAYGVSNMVEGGQDYYYGSIGDLSTDAWNPIRDTIFCGNQALYDTWGNINMTIAALCVPANNALNSVAGASNKVIAKTVTIAVTKEYAKSKVIETVSDQVTNTISDEFNLNKTQTVILGELIEGGIEHGVDKASDAYVKHRDGYLDGDFTDGMSYEDAKRYNEFMNRDINTTNKADLERIGIADIDADSPNSLDLNKYTESIDNTKNASTNLDNTQDSAAMSDFHSFDSDSADSSKINRETVTDSNGATNGDSSPNSNIDWEHTSNTPEELAQIREIEENREFIEKVETKNKVYYEDHGAVKPESVEMPSEPTLRKPTENSGTIIGDRDSGTFEFIPDNKETQKIMAKYGQESVSYNNNVVDFKPFCKQDTPWGTAECEVEIGHMVSDRTGRDSFDPGNYKQADTELAKTLSEKFAQEITPEQIQRYRVETKLTWHEDIDGKTMQLVPYEINRDCKHTGGVAYTDYIREIAYVDSVTN